MCLMQRQYVFISKETETFASETNIAFCLKLAYQTISLVLRKQDKVDIIKQTHAVPSCETLLKECFHDEEKHRFLKKTWVLK